MRPLVTALLFTLLPTVAVGQRDSAAIPNIRALADSVASAGSTFSRTRRLVYWVNDTFTWSATDYVRRTPEQIIARRAGNCADLASVLRLFLDSLGVRSRWVREINLQPAPSPDRQERAAAMIATRGNSVSVFGLQHNDHVWLEVWDDSSRGWFPADAAYGVVGLADWSAARLALDHRPKPRVKAVEPIATDMLVPFVVTAGERRNGPYAEDRTSFYLEGAFDRLYGGKLAMLPSWSLWTKAVESLSPHARAAFEGSENLHARNDEIAALKRIYDALGREAAARGITWMKQ